MIVKSRITASAANATTLTHTLGFNGASDAWTVRSASVAPTGNAGSFSAGGITPIAGKKHIIFVNLRNNLIGTPSAAEAGKTLVVTCTNIEEWGYDLVTLDSTTATYQATASKGYGFTQDPHITATALTVPAGGIGFVHELTYVAAVDPYIGTTEIGKRSEYWMGSVADNCFPGSVHRGDFTFGMALAIAYGP